MTYTSPKEVTAPQDHWMLHRVLLDGGPGEPSYALGTWDGKRCIGARWNGDEDNAVGWPRVFVHPCWHILDERLDEAVIALLPDYRDKIHAMRFLNGEPV